MELQTIYTEEELKRIQSIQLACLKEIVGLCNTYDIEYFLIGGSALGAIRHNGYIPWDDDIDIAIPRKDYQKFLQIAKQKLPGKYHVQTPYDCTNSPYFYSKIRIDGTVFMEYCNRNLDIHQGVYVDVFPYDNLPDDEQLNKKHFDKCQRLIWLFTFRQIPDVSCKPVGLVQYFKAAVRRCIHWVCRLVPYRYLLNKLEKEFTRFDDVETKAMGCLNISKRKTEYILRTDLYPLVKHKFEDTEFFVPNNCDEYLRTHYGDWNQLPPKELRFGHKPYKISL